jgi:predicted CoA-substrate-specific enzyme activase
MNYYCGIDIGASTVKLVIVDENRQVAAQSLKRSGIDYSDSAEVCLNEALTQAGLERDQVVESISTGYGRDNVSWATGKKTEIACHGKGAHENFSQSITVIDIGAQDNKVIHMDEAGRQTGFKMNRKCAAGTGAFIEEIALRLDLPVSDLNGLAEKSTKDVSLGSFCTVFAATEILAKIRAGDKVEDIVKGAFRSVAKRILEMDVVSNTLVLTGGVIANNPVMAELVEESFGKDVIVPAHPQYIGALGAALFALKSAEKENNNAD